MKKIYFSFMTRTLTPAVFFYFVCLAAPSRRVSQYSRTSIIDAKGARGNSELRSGAGDFYAEGAAVQPTFIPCISDAEHSSDFSKKRNKRKEKRENEIYYDSKIHEGLFKKKNKKFSFFQNQYKELLLWKYISSRDSFSNNLTLSAIEAKLTPDIHGTPLLSKDYSNYYTTIYSLLRDQYIIPYSSDINSNFLRKNSFLQFIPAGSPSPILDKTASEHSCELMGIPFESTIPVREHRDSVQEEAASHPGALFPYGEKKGKSASRKGAEGLQTRRSDSFFPLYQSYIKRVRRSREALKEKNVEYKNSTSSKKKNLSFFHQNAYPPDGGGRSATYLEKAVIAAPDPQGSREGHARENRVKIPWIYTPKKLIVFQRGLKREPVFSLSKIQDSLFYVFNTYRGELNTKKLRDGLRCLYQFSISLTSIFIASSFYAILTPAYNYKWVNVFRGTLCPPLANRVTNLPTLPVFPSALPPPLGGNKTDRTPILYKDGLEGAVLPPLKADAGGTLPILYKAGLQNISFYSSFRSRSCPFPSPLGGGGEADGNKAVPARSPTGKVRDPEKVQQEKTSPLQGKLYPLYGSIALTQNEDILVLQSKIANLTLLTKPSGFIGNINSKGGRGATPPPIGGVVNSNLALYARGRDVRPKEFVNFGSGSDIDKSTPPIGGGVAPRPPQNILKKAKDSLFYSLYKRSYLNAESQYWTFDSLGYVAAPSTTGAANHDRLQWNQSSLVPETNTFFSWTAVPPAASYSGALFPCGEKTFIPCISNAEHSSDFSKKSNKSNHNVVLVSTPVCRKGKEAPHSSRALNDNQNFYKENKTRHVLFPKKLFIVSSSLLLQFDKRWLDSIPLITLSQPNGLTFYTQTESQRSYNQQSPRVIKRSSLMIKAASTLDFLKEQGLFRQFFDKKEGTCTISTDGKKILISSKVGDETPSEQIILLLQNSIDNIKTKSMVPTSKRVQGTYLSRAFAVDVAPRTHAPPIALESLTREQTLSQECPMTQELPISQLDSIQPSFLEKSPLRNYVPLWRALSLFPSAPFEGSVRGTANQNVAMATQRVADGTPMFYKNEERPPQGSRQTASLLKGLIDRAEKQSITLNIQSAENFDYNRTGGVLVRAYKARATTKNINYQHNKKYSTTSEKEALNNSAENQYQFQTDFLFFRELFPPEGAAKRTKKKKIFADLRFRPAFYKTKPNILQPIPNRISSSSMFHLHPTPILYPAATQPTFRWRSPPPERGVNKSKDGFFQTASPIKSAALGVGEQYLLKTKLLQRLYLEQAFNKYLGEPMIFDKAKLFYLFPLGRLTSPSVGNSIASVSPEGSPSTNMERAAESRQSYLKTGVPTFINMFKSYSSFSPNLLMQDQAFSFPVAVSRYRETPLNIDRSSADNIKEKSFLYPYGVKLHYDFPSAALPFPVGEASELQKEQILSPLGVGKGFPLGAPSLPPLLKRKGGIEDENRALKGKKYFWREASPGYKLEQTTHINLKDREDQDKHDLEIENLELQNREIEDREISFLRLLDKDTQQLARLTKQQESTLTERKRERGLPRPLWLPFNLYNKLLTKRYTNFIFRWSPSAPPRQGGKPTTSFSIKETSFGSSTSPISLGRKAAAPLRGAGGAAANQNYVRVGEAVEKKGVGNQFQGEIQSIATPLSGGGASRPPINGNNCTLFSGEAGHSLGSISLPPGREVSEKDLALPYAPLGGAEPILSKIDQGYTNTNDARRSGELYKQQVFSTLSYLGGFKPNLTHSSWALSKTNLALSFSSTIRPTSIWFRERYTTEEDDLINYQRKVLHSLENKLSPIFFSSSSFPFFRSENISNPFSLLSGGAPVPFREPTFHQKRNQNVVLVDEAAPLLPLKEPALPAPLGEGKQTGSLPRRGGIEDAKRAGQDLQAELNSNPAVSHSGALFLCGEKTFIPCISDAEHSSDFSKKRNKRNEIKNYANKSSPSTSLQRFTDELKSNNTFKTSIETTSSNFWLDAIEGTSYELSRLRTTSLALLSKASFKKFKNKEEKINYLLQQPSVFAPFPYQNYPRVRTNQNVVLPAATQPKENKEKREIGSFPVPFREPTFIYKRNNGKHNQKVLFLFGQKSELCSGDEQFYKCNNSTLNSSQTAPYLSLNNNRSSSIHKTKSNVFHINILRQNPLFSFWWFSQTRQSSSVIPLKYIFPVLSEQRYGEKSERSYGRVQLVDPKGSNSAVSTLDLTLRRVNNYPFVFSFFFVCTSLFHFCCLYSLISISQIRFFLKIPFLIVVQSTRSLWVGFLSRFLTFAIKKKVMKWRVLMLTPSGFKDEVTRKGDASLSVCIEDAKGATDFPFALPFPSGQESIDRRSLPAPFSGIGRIGEAQVWGAAGKKRAVRLIKKKKRESKRTGSVDTFAAGKTAVMVSKASSVSTTLQTLLFSSLPVLSLQRLEHLLESISRGTTTPLLYLLLKGQGGIGDPKGAESPAATLFPYGEKTFINKRSDKLYPFYMKFSKKRNHITLDKYALDKVLDVASKLQFVFLRVLDIIPEVALKLKFFFLKVLDVASKLQFVFLRVLDIIPEVALKLKFFFLKVSKVISSFCRDPYDSVFKSFESLYQSYKKVFNRILSYVPPGEVIQDVFFVFFNGEWFLDFRHSIHNRLESGLWVSLIKIPRSLYLTGPFAFFVQHAAYNLIEQFLVILNQPDTDLINQQKEETIFWDFWRELILQVAANNRSIFPQSLISSSVFITENTFELDAIRKTIKDRLDNKILEDLEWFYANAKYFSKNYASISTSPGREKQDNFTEVKTSINFLRWFFPREAGEIGMFRSGNITTPLSGGDASRPPTKQFVAPSVSKDGLEAVLRFPFLFFRPQSSPFGQKFDSFNSEKSLPYGKRRIWTRGAQFTENTWNTRSQSFLRTFPSLFGGSVRGTATQKVADESGGLRSFDSSKSLLEERVSYLPFSLMVRTNYLESFTPLSGGGERHLNSRKKIEHKSMLRLDETAFLPLSAPFASTMHAEGVKPGGSLSLKRQGFRTGSEADGKSERRSRQNKYKSSEKWQHRAANQYISMPSVLKQGLFIHQVYPKHFTRGTHPYAIDARTPEARSSEKNKIDLSFSYYPTIGNLILKIDSGLFSQEGAKNVLVIGEEKTDKTSLIQAIAGETELDIIMEKAKSFDTFVNNFPLGIRTFREIFEAIPLHAPCLFLLEDIHIIGKARAWYLTEEPDYENLNDLIFGEEDKLAREHDEISYVYSPKKWFFYRQAFPCREQDYQSHYKTIHYSSNKRVSSPLSLPTAPSVFRERFAFLEFQPSQNYPEHSSDFSKKRNDPQREKQYCITDLGGVDYKRSLTKQTFAVPRIKDEKTCLEVSKPIAIIPPATSPLTLLMLKEEQRLQPRKQLNELPWDGIPEDQLLLIPRYLYSIHIKVLLTLIQAYADLDKRMIVILDLLVVLDSVGSNRGLVVYATTHLPSILDPILRRPGRLEETIHIPVIGSGFVNRWQTLEFVCSMKDSSSIVVSFRFATRNLINTFIQKRNVVIQKRSSAVIGVTQFLASSMPPLTRRVRGSIAPTFQRKGKAPTGFKNDNTPPIGGGAASRPLNLPQSFLSSSVPLPFAVAERFPQGNTSKMQGDTYSSTMHSSPKGAEQRSLQGSRQNQLGCAPTHFARVNKEKSAAFTAVIEHLPCSQRFSQSSYRWSQSAPPRQGGRPTNKTSNFFEDIWYVRAPEHSSDFSKKRSKQYSSNLCFAAYLHVADLFSSLQTFSQTKKTTLQGLQFLHSRRNKREQEQTKKQKEGSYSLLSWSRDHDRDPYAENQMVIDLRGTAKAGITINVLKTFLLGNKKSLGNPAGVPFSSVIFPSERFENYKRAEKDYQQKALFSLSEKIDFQYTQKKTELLFGKQLKQNSFSWFSYQGGEDYTNWPRWLLGEIDERIKIEPTATNWYSRKKILNRHWFYFIHQWWNGQLFKSNLEETFYSDVEWRIVNFLKRKIYPNKAPTLENTIFGKTLVDTVVPRQESVASSLPLREPAAPPFPLGGGKADKPYPEKRDQMLTGNIGENLNVNEDWILDFPDPESFYNPKERRWMLTNGSWSYWFELDLLDNDYLTECCQNFMDKKKLQKIRVQTNNSILSLDKSERNSEATYLLQNNNLYTFYFTKLSKKRELFDYLTYKLLETGFLKELDFYMQYTFM